MPARSSRVRHRTIRREEKPTAGPDTERGRDSARDRTVVSASAAVGLGMLSAPRSHVLNLFVFIAQSVCPFSSAR